MDELEQSLKYVPTYQMVERIRKEEMLIAEDKLAVANDKIKMEKERRKKLELVTASALSSKGVSIQDIAKIMDLPVKRVDKILKVDD